MKKQYNHIYLIKLDVMPLWIEAHWEPNTILIINKREILAGEEMNRRLFLSASKESMGGKLLAENPTGKSKIGFEVSDFVSSRFQMFVESEGFTKSEKNQHLLNHTVGM